MGSRLPLPRAFLTAGLAGPAGLQLLASAQQGGVLAAWLRGRGCGVLDRAVLNWQATVAKAASRPAHQPPCMGTMAFFTVHWCFSLHSYPFLPGLEASSHLSQRSQPARSFQQAARTLRSQVSRACGVSTPFPDPGQAEGRKAQRAAPLGPQERRPPTGGGAAAERWRQRHSPLAVQDGRLQHQPAPQVRAAVSRLRAERLRGGPCQW